MDKGKKKRYPRDEGIYNLVQENEIFVFLRYLPLAALWVAKNESLWCGTGRPPKKIYDILICLAIKRYFGKSLRRSMGLLRLLKRLGAIHVEIPCFKTLDNYQHSRAIKPYLRKLIRLTSNPLKLLEYFFSTDSTGVSTTCYSAWYDIRTRKKSKKRRHLMIHVTTGTRLNVAASLDVRAKKGEDSKILRKHVAEVARSFEVKEWSGDSAYLSRENCNAVATIEAEPWFKLKSNTTARSKGSPAWRRMVRTFREEPETADPKYHRRSNGEATISAKNRKFGSFVRARDKASQENEETLAWIGYNFSVLSRAYYEYGIVPEFAM
ncbi:MAG: hypothetical protein ACE5IH_10155 [Thermodesulfobacteriota bacterium]